MKQNNNTMEKNYIVFNIKLDFGKRSSQYRQIKVIKITVYFLILRNDSEEFGTYKHDFKPTSIVEPTKLHRPTLDSCNSLHIDPKDIFYTIYSIKLRLID